MRKFNIVHKTQYINTSLEQTPVPDQKTANQIKP